MFLKRLMIGSGALTALAVGALALRPVEVLDVILPTAAATVPERSTIALFALGAAGFGIARVLRDRKAK